MGNGIYFKIAGLAAKLKIEKGGMKLKKIIFSSETTETISTKRC
jgi:hypothetical protein